MMDKASPKHFIHDIIDADQARRRTSGAYPLFAKAEGSLHIKHTKSMYLNFSIARAYQGEYNLRMNDFNPDNENLLIMHHGLEAPLPAARFLDACAPLRGGIVSWVSS